MLTRFLSFIALTSFTLTCYAQIQVTDSLGTHQLDKPAVRVAALNWDIAEQLLELDVTPIAIPDINGYREWVVKPAIPNSVEDIGTRMEPNLSELAKLHPDLIIIAGPQQPLLEKLEKIAPVLVYETYKADHNNIDKSIEHFKSIAVAVGKEQRAQDKLNTMYRRLDNLKTELTALYPNGKPKVSVFRFASTTTIYLYGDNSSAMYALNKLGFEAALPMPASQWGVTQKRVKDLYKTGDGLALYFKPFHQEKELQDSVMWQAMPFVKNNKVAAVEPAWNYGGAISLLYVAEVLSDSLKQMAQKGDTQ
ncbi:iron-siderophore ABC transporter substrate-binding protein [Vibrio tapetis]|uniref:Putative ABC-type Fe3+-hydroxamate transport system, periplasmic component n=1 Tax=Vibrio tapetis subsp. tapetis TaxID=1671868 RepID=A0A2N8ZDX7_9VIBR|nr:iron-siderophore ABC transporter substrate-binding protein [Vibrio tapetis]SON50080.1 putative ABC-type Fe3+-hydroxamate transport system, periplasmic component [Vibrio tapetis subsp. tapetis]